jgi:hypothetical protein
VAERGAHQVTTTLWICLVAVVAWLGYLAGYRRGMTHDERQWVKVIRSMKRRSLTPEQLQARREQIR